MARLVVNSESSAAWEIHLKPGPNFIGRGFSNDFRIDDGSVSGSHCEIVLTDTGATIRDLGSTNGTFLNGAPVKEAPLRGGQRVRLGNVEMVFHLDPVVQEGPTVTGLGADVPKPRVAARGASTGPIRVTLKQPQTESVPVPPPMPTASREAPFVPPGGAAQCKFHPRSPARWLCGQCQHYFCDLCVNVRQGGDSQKRYCRHCATECAPVYTPAPAAPPSVSFFGRLPQAFAYPFRGVGIMVLLLGGVVLSAMGFLFGRGGISLAVLFGAPYQLPWSAWQFFMQLSEVLILGYLFVYMQSIIHGTAAGERELPPVPGAADFWSDILQPSLQVLGLLLVCFGPGLALRAWAALQGMYANPMLVLVLGILGSLYLPMAMLVVALLDSVLAAHPGRVFSAILKAPLEYLTVLFVLGAAAGIYWLGDSLLPALFPRGLSTRVMVRLFGYVLTQIAWSVVTLYLLTLVAHVLGLLFASKRQQLNWLPR
jgi:hypothetical protein